MAVKLNEPVRLCRILTNGPVPVLGGISGPITRCKLTNSQIIAAMRGGHRVAEYNPDKSGRYEELTLDNNGASPFAVAPAVKDSQEKAKPVKKNKKPTPAVPETPAVEDPVENPAPVAEVKGDPVEKVPTVEDSKPAEETPVADIAEGTAEEVKEDAQESSDTTDVTTKKEIVIDVTTNKNTGSKRSKKSGGGKR